MFPTSLCINTMFVPILQLKKLRHGPELHSLSGETGFLSGNLFPQPCVKEIDTVSIIKLKNNNKNSNKAGRGQIGSGFLYRERHPDLGEFFLCLELGGVHFKTRQRYKAKQQNTTT